MMSLFLALHIHAAERGDGLRPEFLQAAPQRRDVPKAAHESPVAQAEAGNAASRLDPRIRRVVRKPVVL